jgi:hypothetical protein
MNEPKQKPVKQYRRRAIGVSIWKREVQTQEGTTVFYSATASRAYTKDEGKTFEYTDNFDADDLPVVASLLTLAFMWIASETNKGQ